MLSDLTTGLLTGLGLIVAIGAQNAYVLRQGVRRSHVGLVVALCALSDVVLITAGIAGIGVLITGAPWLLVLLRWGGVIYLVWFAISSFRSAARAEALEADDAPPAARGVALTVLALTWLNPHVYLDTVLMLGSVANQHGDGRWWFGLGAMAASILWFSGLGFGARALAPVLARRRVWQVLDVLIGLVMLLIAAKLALG